jgi:peroxiredoxin Q/BCP
MGRTSMGIQRATAVIDADGNVKRWWPKVKPDEHADQVLAEL